MSVISIRNVLILVGVLTVACMVWAAMSDDKALSIVSAFVFCAAVVLASGCAIRELWFSHPGEKRKTPVESARMHAGLMALTFGWGACVMLGVYTLSGLWWWHSWQYGALMGALAVVLLVYSRALSHEGHLLRSIWYCDVGAMLALLQGVGAGVGVWFLMTSDKLSSIKPDWPANHVFLAGGIAICVISFVAAGSHMLTRRRSLASEFD